MIRIATVGTGPIVRTFLRTLADVDGIQAACAYSRDLARAQAFAAEHGVPAASSDLDALLRSGDVDAVYLASPNALHAEQALRAVRAGRHVLVEKPATLTPGEFSALVAEADAHGVVVFEGMRSVYDPAFDEIRRLLAELGPVRLVSLSYCQRSARYDLVLAGQRVNIFDPALGGGALNDLGVYPVSALVALFGEPHEVTAAQVTVASGADGAGAALLRYPGFSAVATYSKITASALPSQIQGERATLEIDHLAAPARLTLRGIDGTVTVHELRDAASNTGGPEHNMAFEVRRFLELIGGADAAPDHARTLAALRVMERIREA
ncbi:MAG: Gfo/Idh/MocA family oxidoreductase [Microbacterium sp.]